MRSAARPLGPQPSDPDGLVPAPTELLPEPADVSEKEIKGALALMESMSRDDLEGHDFKDTSTEAMEQIIEAKWEEKPRPDAPEPEKPGRVLDLMAALEESVSAAKAPRGEDSDVHELPRKKAAAKNTTAKKQQAKVAGSPSGTTASTSACSRASRSGCSARWCSAHAKAAAVVSIPA